MMELLAPAGSAASLEAAVQNGADAVYIGGKRFSARWSAENFSEEEIKEAVKLCHLHGVKLHVAANILVKPGETADFLDYMGFLNSAGVDAVIIQDIGMAQAVRKTYPDLPLHASTQMTAASLSTVKYLENMGFSRVVLARELSEKQIAAICRGTNVEIEVFVHGAICMCYSGQCLMSSIIGARSGNRGLCAQPCRLPYKYEKNGKVLREGYLLSPKDMSLIDSLERLEKCGVASLKLEGRLKRTEYVSAVTAVYRKYLDNPANTADADRQTLENAFSRSGFTDGYFRGETGAHMMSCKVPGNTSTQIGAEKVLPKRYPLNIYCKMRKGEKLYIKITNQNGISAEAYSCLTVQKALNRPTDKKRLTEQLTKLGESVFFAQNTVVETEEDANIPIKEINECRRKAVSELERKLCEIPERRQKNPPPTPFYEKKEHLMLTAQVETEEQLRACEDAGVEVIYIPVSLIKEARRGSCQYVVRLPEICDSERIYDIPKEFGVLISSVGQALQYPEYKKYGNFRLNIVNDYSAELFADYESVALSQELNMKELMTLHPGVPAETVGYGKLPLMIMKNCPRRAIEGQCKKDRAVLRDRKNETFEFSCDGECHSILLNSKNIYMADRVKDFEKTAISRIRLMFFDEKYEKTRAVIEEYRRGIDGETVAKPPENSCTRGHFYRGVQ